MKEFKLQNLDIQPASVEARSFCNISFSFSFEFDLPKDSFLIFRLRGGRNNKNDWYLMQAEDPNRQGFVRLSSNKNILMLPIAITGKELLVKYLICEENGIIKDSILMVEILNTLAQSLVEKNKKIEIFVEFDNRSKIKASNPPSINVVHKEFDHMKLTCPSIVYVDESFNLHTRIEDKFKNLVKDFEGPIRFSILPENESKIPIADVNISKEDGGIKKQTNLSIPKPGILYIEAFYNNVIYSSNPIVCQEKESKKKLYWGYIHGHTNKSDGMRDINEYFSNLIDAGLDFGMSTEHDHLYETSDEDFREIKSIVKKYNEDSKFVSFFGYEYGTWYSGYGDICIYHNLDDIPILRSEINKYNSTQKMIKSLRSFEGNVLLIAHHTALRSGFRNWDYFDNSIEKLVEIYSTWGNQEYPHSEGNPIPPRYKFYGHGKHALKRGAILEKRNSFVRDALKRGYKLGFTAGGDDHFGLYPSGQIDPDNGLYPPGIMAVWSEALTKDAIWNALMNRKCYGTTGPRVIIEFSLNEYFMGDIINLKENGKLRKKRKLKVKIISPIKIMKLELIRNNDILLKQDIYEKKYNFEHIDKKIFKDICLRHSTDDEDFVFYYVRVFLEGENMAWSSPIWIIQ